MFRGPHGDSINQATRPRRWFFPRLQGSTCPANGRETVTGDFMCHLDWPQGAHIKTLFLDVSVRVKGLAFQSVDSADCPPQCVWASSNPWTTWIQQKVKEGGIHFFFSCLTAWVTTSHLLCFTGPQTQDWITHGFPGSPACRRQIGGLLNQFVIISLSLYLLLVLYLWRTLTKTHIASLLKHTTETS